MTAWIVGGATIMDPWLGISELDHAASGLFPLDQLGLEKEVSSNGFIVAKLNGFDELTAHLKMRLKV